MIVCDERNPRARAILDDLSARLPKGWQPPDGLALVIGGDGFLLKTVAEYGLELAYLGLNAGHLGFLLNDVRDRDELVSSLEDGRWTVHRFPLLEAEILGVDGERTVARAINDVYLERSTGQAARLSITIDGYRAVESMVADGVVFATALGSTAYAYSAGGQPLHPSLDLMQVAPICPHLPRLTPFVLPSTARAQVEVEQPQWRPVRAVADGRAVEAVQEVSVAVAEERVRLAYLDSHDFTQQMLHKIVHP
jgi:NAD+ kinase